MALCYKAWTLIADQTKTKEPKSQKRVQQLCIAIKDIKILIAECIVTLHNKSHNKISILVQPLKADKNDDNCHVLNWVETAGVYFRRCVVI